MIDKKNKKLIMNSCILPMARINNKGRQIYTKSFIYPPINVYTLPIKQLEIEPRLGG